MTPATELDRLFLEQMAGTTFPKPRNQCDGCVAGMPMRDGLHYNERGHSHMCCQSARYATPVPEFKNPRKGADL